MAAASTSFAAATGSAALVSATKGDASRLSSGNAFRTTSMVQFAPVSSKRSTGVVAARASLSEDSKDVKRDMLVSILAASAALGFSVSVVDGGFANPIDAAKSKATTTLKSAQDAAPSLPSAPSLGKPGPFSKSDKVVASTNGGTGSAIGDAKKRISEFGKNPIADNLNEGTKKTENAIASAKSPKPNSERVSEATDKVGNITSDLQTKGSDTISEGKSFIGEQTQGSVPTLPNVFPKLPTPEIPTPDTSGLKDFKSGVQSKVEDAKSAAGSALPQ